jgi:hypothetical protein
MESTRLITRKYMLLIHDRVGDPSLLHFIICYIHAHCATSLKAVGSIPEGVIGIFYLHNSSGCPVALRSNE